MQENGNKFSTEGANRWCTTLTTKLSGERTAFGCNSGKSDGHRRSKPSRWISQVSDRAQVKI